jgi:hypothetical protein
MSLTFLFLATLIWRLLKIHLTNTSGLLSSMMKKHGGNMVGNLGL